MHMHSMCRQINGCENNVSEWITGTKGSTNCKNKIFDLAGNEIYSFPYPQDEKEKQADTSAEDKKKAAKPEVQAIPVKNPYDQEHVDLVTCIRKDIPVNEAEATAMSCLVAIMGRVSAYTGKAVTMEEMMNSGMKLGPETYIMGDVGIMKNVVIPVPGEAPKE
jgi:hypothetical protein